MFTASAHHHQQRTNLPSSRLFAFTLLVLGILPYHDSVANILPYVLSAHAVPLSRREEPKTFTRRIVAVGDLHGDYESTIEILKFADVINDKEEWSGKVDFFVQTGDIIDKGPDTIKLFEYMEKLRNEASNNEGVVISLLGNHEWMNAIGRWQDVDEGDVISFNAEEVVVDEDEYVDAMGKWIGYVNLKDSENLYRALGKRMAMMSKATGSIAKSWARNYTTAARLPLHHSIGPPNTPYYPSTTQDKHKDGALSHAALSFVHGGLSPTYSKISPFPVKINEISDTLLHKLQMRSPQPIPWTLDSILRREPEVPLPDNVSEEEKELYSSNGPLWYRGWVRDPEEKVCRTVDRVLQDTGTRRMIMGHTTNDDWRITSRCKGKIIIIDTGISDFYGGRLSALSIRYTLKPLGKAETPEVQQWEENELINALYDESEVVLLVNSTRQVVGNFM